MTVLRGAQAPSSPDQDQGGVLLDAQSQVAYDRARDVLDASSEARRKGYVRSVRALGVLLGSAEPRAHWLVVGASDQDDGSVPVAWLDEFGTRQPLDLADGYAEAVTDLCATLPWKWTGTPGCVGAGLSPSMWSVASGRDNEDRMLFLEGARALPEVPASAESRDELDPGALEAFMRAEQSRARMMLNRAHIAATRALAGVIREQFPGAWVALVEHKRGEVVVSGLRAEDGAVLDHDQVRAEEALAAIQWGMTEGRPWLRWSESAATLSLDAALAPLPMPGCAPSAPGIEDEHVYLVAVTVEAPDRATGHLRLHDALGPALAHPRVDSWWVAEPDRLDRSDCASAHFVDSGPVGAPCY